MAWRWAEQRGSERQNCRDRVVFKEWTLDLIGLRMREEKTLDNDDGEYSEGKCVGKSK